MANQTTPAASPTLGNAMVGITGIGTRAVVAGTVGAVAVTRVALRPAAVATRAVLRSPPGAAVRNDLRTLIEALDAAGRRDLERARARLGRTLDDSIDRAIDELLDSPRSKRAVEQILESDQLWVLVDRIANSAEVLDAITSTSVGPRRRGRRPGAPADGGRRRRRRANRQAAAPPGAPGAGSAR